MSSLSSAQLVDAVNGHTCISSIVAMPAAAIPLTSFAAQRQEIAELEDLLLLGSHAGQVVALL